ncbi:putative membrane protein [Bradyrhizobium sp. AZCC 1678]|uniref:hypothetical protein n=1 Tax=Bradyrhizobium sp. AZCC 1678 TaxID=3117030 RepID=UPI002FEEEE76
MESLQGIELIFMSATTPPGIAVLFFAFLISCLSRVFLRSNLLKNLYLILSFGPLLYLLVLGIAFGIPSIAPSNIVLVAALLTMFLGVPFSIGWLLGWSIAVLLQTASTAE